VDNDIRSLNPLTFVFAPGSQLENITWWCKNILGGGKHTFEGRHKHTKCIKVGNNLENFRGQDCY